MTNDALWRPILSYATPQYSPYSHSIVPGGFDVMS
jgi:hypothetical protein